MTVLSRILYGTVTARTYDIIEHFENADEGNSGEPSKSWMPKFMSRVWNSAASPSTSSSSLSTLSAAAETATSATNINHRIPRGSIHVYENPLRELSSSEITELYPTKGNVHEFTAGRNGAAVLDVLVPPYDVDNERDCTFYKEDLNLHVPQLPRTDDEGGVTGNVQFDTTRRRKWLVPISQPDWFHCISGKYGDIGE